MIIYEIAVYLIPLVTAPYIARVLGTEGTGVYSYTYSIANYFIVFIQLGVTLYGRREIASKTDPAERSKAFWSIFSVITVMFFVSGAIYLVMCFTVESAYSTALLIQGFLLLAAWLDICWLFFGIEKFALAVSQNIFLKLASLVLVFVLVKDAGDTNLYIGMMSVSSFLGVFIMWVVLPKYVSAPKIKFRDVVPHLKPLIIMTVPVLSVQLFSLTDKVLLGMMVDVDSVGVYGNVYKIARIPISIISTIGTVLLPRITNMIARGKEKETFAYIERSLSFTMIVGCSCAFGLCSIAPTFVPLYLGEEFRSGVPVLQILCFILIVIAFGNVFRTQYILPRKMDSVYLVSVAGAAAVNIVLNLLMIPHFGAIGAAVASLISEFVICIYQSVRIRRDFRFFYLIKCNFKYVLAGAVMGIAVYYTGVLFDGISVVSVCVQTAVGAAVFGLLSIVFECISGEYVIVGELRKILGRFVKNKG